MRMTMTNAVPGSAGEATQSNKESVVEVSSGVGVEKSTLVVAGNPGVSGAQVELPTVIVPKNKGFANLKPLDTLRIEDAKAIRVLGGQATKGVFKLSKTRNCNCNCPNFTKCYYAPLSRNYDGKCALAQAPDRLNRRVLKKIQDGDRGFFEVVMETLDALDMQTLHQKDVKSLTENIRSHCEVFKTFYGERHLMKVQNETKLTFADIENRIKEAVQDGSPKRDDKESREV
jgi:hypothetical protein